MRRIARRGLQYIACCNFFASAIVSAVYLSIICWTPLDIGPC